MPEQSRRLRELFDRAIAKATRSHPPLQELTLVTPQPAEHCGNQSPTISGLRVPSPTECVLRPGHQGSHADEHGMRWSLTKEPEQQGNPSVQGRCPACGSAGLFLGSGGYVTCPRIGCPNPTAADDLLHQRAPDWSTKQLPTPAAAVEVHDPCPHCGDHQLIPRHRMAEHTARLHPDERRTTTEG